MTKQYKLYSFEDLLFINTTNVYKRYKFYRDTSTNLIKFVENDAIATESELYAYLSNFASYNKLKLADSDSSGDSFNITSSYKAYVFTASEINRATTSGSGTITLTLQSTLSTFASGLDTIISNNYVLFEELGESSYNDNISTNIERGHDYVISAKNQKMAYTYIFTFVLAIVLFNMIYNFSNLTVTHLLVYLIFVGYLLFFESINYSMFMLLKDYIQEVRYQNAAGQVFTYIKLFLIFAFILFLPMIVFLIFDGEYEIPYGNVGIKDTAVSTISAVGDVARERASDGAEIASTAYDKISDATSSAYDTAKERGENMLESARGGVEAVQSRANEFLK